MLLAATFAFAQDLTVPLAGDAAPLTVTAYTLVKPDPALLTTEDRFHTCLVRVTWTPPDVVDAVADGCPDAFGAAAVDAARTWTFTGTVATHAVLTFVLRYEEAIGTLNTTAELDPGAEAALAGERGPPGIRLVHPATPKQPLTTKGTGTCTVRVTVDAKGKAGTPQPQACTEPLATAAAKAATKAKWVPRIEEGVATTSTVDVVVTGR